MYCWMHLIKSYFLNNISLCHHFLIQIWRITLLKKIWLFIENCDFEKISRKNGNLNICSSTTAAPSADKDHVIWPKAPEQLVNGSWGEIVLSTTYKYWLENCCLRWAIHGFLSCQSSCSPTPGSVMCLYVFHRPHYVEVISVIRQHVRLRRWMNKIN